MMRWVKVAVWAFFALLVGIEWFTQGTIRTLLMTVLPFIAGYMTAGYISGRATPETSDESLKSEKDEVKS